MRFSKQYLTFYEYKGLGGNLSETPFNLLEFEARKEIDEQTMGRLVDVEVIPEEVKICVFQLINETDKKNNSVGKQSESVGSYSVTYSTNAKESKEFETRKNSIIHNSLANCFINGTPILYRGI